MNTLFGDDPFPKKRQLKPRVNKPAKKKNQLKVEHSKMASKILQKAETSLSSVVHHNSNGSVKFDDIDLNMIQTTVNSDGSKIVPMIDYINDHG